MAEVTLDELIERTRLESGLRNNAYYDADQIIRYLNAGGSELYDLFTTANQKYVISEFNFTTTGPGDAIVTLPTDFQQGHSLDIFPDNNGQTRTIRYLSNWLNRNAYGANVFSLSPAGMDPVYTFLDNKLRFYPPQNTPAAPFRLYYTPMWTLLAPEVTVNFTINASSVPSVPPPGGLTGNGAWILPGAMNNVDPTTIPDTGFDLVLTFTIGPPDNTPFSGTYPVTDVGRVADGFGDPTFACDNLASTSGFTNPAAGTGTYTFQPFGTRNTLPNVMGPWSEYLVVYAAMAINIDRQRPNGELERKLQALKARISSVIGNRQEEPQQPPLSRGMGWWGGWDGGWQ